VCLRRRAALTIGLITFFAGAVGASWWQARRWQATDEIARSVADGVARAARPEGRHDVVVIDVPDRPPGWRPTAKVPVWRHVLPEALATRRLRVVMQAHAAPGDPETLGFRLTTRSWGPEDVSR
jgi:hypothetical protein